MPKDTLQSPKLPRPIYPISQATRAAGFVFTHGMIGRGPDGRLQEGIAAQSRQIMENLQLIMEEAGGTLTDVLRCEVYVLDMAEFPQFNEVWKEYFPVEPPARCTTQAGGLGAGLRIEITAVAYVGA